MHGTFVKPEQKGYTINRNDEYSRYYEGKYGIKNINKLHKWLYDNGYLRNAYLDEALNLYKVPELKMILESLGLPKTGKKADLIERIKESISDSEKGKVIKDCKYLFPSEKGLVFLKENEDYVMWHRKSYDVTFEEFNKHRILQGRKRRFYDTIFQALNEKSSVYQFNHYFSRLEMIYYNLSEVLHDEGKYDLSLRYALLRLYCSTNLASHTALFEIDLVKLNGIEKEKEYIKSLHEIFNQGTLKRLIELKDYYGEHILDTIYGLQILPYCIFDKMDMADAIHDLYEGTFDEAFYTNYICINYEKYIKKFL